MRLYAQISLANPMAGIPQAGKLLLRPMVAYQLWHNPKWANTASLWMLEADPLHPEGHGGKRGSKERKKTGNIRDLQRAAIPRVLRLFLAGYTPHAFELQSPEKVIAARELYTEMAAAQQS